MKRKLYPSHITLHNHGSGEIGDDLSQPDEVDDDVTLDFIKNY